MRRKEEILDNKSLDKDCLNLIRCSFFPISMYNLANLVKKKNYYIRILLIEKSLKIKKYNRVNNKFQKNIIKKENKKQYFFIIYNFYFL